MPRNALAILYLKAFSLTLAYFRSQNFHVEKVHLSPIFPIPDIQLTIINYYNNNGPYFFIIQKLEFSNPTPA